MDQEYWQQKWRSKEIGFDQQLPNKLMQRFFPSLKLPPGSRIFVPLCGKSIDMCWFAEQGYEVIGVEFSALACEAFFNDHSLAVKVTETQDWVKYKSEKITIFCGDFFKLSKQTLGRIDAVYDRAAFVALSEKIRKLYSQRLIQLMDSMTSMLLITTAYDQHEMEGPPFSISEAEVSNHCRPHFNIQKVYSKTLRLIPPHLHAKGLTKATEQTYVLMPLN
jgi:thiopurine S-methyltransferase